MEIAGLCLPLKPQKEKVGIYMNLHCSAVTRAESFPYT